ncbi:carboxylate--amine ligase/circularly permuted type 2 ATP-grasp protein [Rhodococcus sp. IEGM 1408]|uniref:carboxylate--amine ligase/circularly permuted type 2 ATP-grasp protein n=1 Tax=Rhodococcus sp. IEGM 1408 TaxID=3082220 RepID=UPI0029543AB2|nr:carboxylate--amine ligase/circularly permuted type 2 ATP-grasp protein [Rhodococcus sp. IEGM 1408]MDV8000009.1 carboxylate--amine ligase/circularly permuted type 2 ATP-grasp protein [Rhodococcus sp. IEGM 1408]
MTDAQRWIRLEEELHLVDMKTRRPVRRAADVLAALGDTGEPGQEGHVRAEQHGALLAVEAGTHTGLGRLGDALGRNRARLAEVAGGLRTGVIAAGSLASPGVAFEPAPQHPHPAPGRESQTRASAGFRVVVQTADADEAQYAARRVAAVVPVLLALSASSPYWADGSDSGYASTRYFEAQWSPAHLPAYAADTAAEALALEDQVVATGVVAGREAISVDVRPSRDGAGIELVACDSCSTIDTLVVVAALFRAAVDRVLAARGAGHDTGSGRWDGPSDAVLAAAFWRAARSGLEGDLVDVATGRPRPATEVLTGLVDDHAEHLRSGGEMELVLDLLDGVRSSGTSATRQRAAHRRRGRRSDVIAVLMAETVGRIRPRETADDPGMRSMLGAYSPLGEAVTEEVHDEAISENGVPRPEYVDVLKAVSDLGPEALRERKEQVDERLGALGVTLKVYGRDEPQVFPLDAVPRIVPADQWARITTGIEQRARAMEMFLRDIYGAGEITRAGVVPAEALQRAPGFRPTGRSVPEGVLHAPVCGVDLVSTAPGEWIVLEDNLRMPGGLAMAVALRDRITEGYPEFGARSEVHDPRDALGMLSDTLRAAAPEGVDDPAIAVVIAEDERGSFDLNQVSAAIGGVLVTPDQLRCEGNRVWRTEGSGSEPVDLLFVRMDEEMLLSSTGADGTVLRRGLLSAMAQGGVAVVNAPGNGAADDKAVYALVPKIIDFYLGEKPLIGQVDTLLCADPEQLQQVLDRLGELVVKPIDGYGGSDITVGPECSPRELDERREELRRHGDRFVAQEVQPLSTLPTFDGRELQRRHVDMRAFVMLRAGASGEILASAPPVALTRVAPAGTMVVNASSGGGGKDTWIHRA